MTLTRSASGLRLRVVGELDIAGARRPELLLTRLEKSPRAVEVDLAGDDGVQALVRFRLSEGGGTVRARDDRDRPATPIGTVP